MRIQASAYAKPPSHTSEEHREPVSLPKHELVGTGAWFFLIVNLAKVPLSVALGLIGPQTLTLNLVLLPVVFTGVAIGRWLTHRVPQRLFDGLLLAFAATAALRLVGAW